MIVEPANSKEEVFSRIRKESPAITALGVRRIGVFGSFIKDSVHFKSDIDICVEFNSGKKNYDSFMELYFLLEQLLGRKIELVTPESLSKHIGPHILKEVQYVPISS
jgi:predicted nucleotidyltransferase